MQAITVKLLPATNTKPTRYKASCAGGSHTRSSDYCNHEVECATTARELCQKLEWNGKLAQGTTKSGEAVFVFVKSDNLIEVN